MKIYFPIFTLAAAMVVNGLNAQSYGSVHYDTKDGLPSATVYDISQDINGFIWFATENGLSRFDGKNFKTFTTKNGLPDNSILKVHGDNTGRVYFTPFTHSLYYLKNDSIYKFPMPDKYKEDLADVAMFGNSGSDLFFCGLLDTYRIRDNYISSLHDENKRLPAHIALHRTYDSLIIAGSSDSFYLISRSGNVLTTPLDTMYNQMFDSAAHITHTRYVPNSKFRYIG
jgi:hypothetical protein